ncbi:hypothetical protein D3C72_2493600 [compost metagenome]
MVDNAVKRGKRLIRDMRNYALLQGLSSVKPLAEQKMNASPPSQEKEIAPQIFTDEEIRVLPEEIPIFKGFMPDEFNLGGVR